MDSLDEMDLNDEDLIDELNDEDYAYDDEDVMAAYDEDTKPSHKQSYTILSAAEIRKRQDDAISQVSSTLSLSSLESRILLHHYDWSVIKAQEEWFADENNVRTAAGLQAIDVAKPLQKRKRKRKRTTCEICFDGKLSKSMAAAACGHQYCLQCWKGFFESAISEGPGCLSVRCPEPSCKAVVSLDMFNEDLVDIEKKEKYYGYFLQSYVEKISGIKWCPAPDCEFSVEFDYQSDGNIYDVQCKCLHAFCWNCVEDVHRPVDCETVAKWLLKNSSEAENTQWILSYTKPCPKCKKPIEKNHGCNHMTCRNPCGHQFCWICLRSAKEHGYNYNCNRYTSEIKESESVRERARRSLERYTHYYERWASNNRSRLHALEELRNLEPKIEVAKEKVKHMENFNFEFITEAWKQIVEGRRVLKWTYAYGYYNIEGDQEHKKDYFEYVQGLAESSLEQLHHCAEQEKNQYFDEGGNMDGIFEYRLNIINRTKAVGEYFGKLVHALETGLQDVLPGQHPDQERQQFLYSDAGTSYRSSVAVGAWECRFCTFVNEKPPMICTSCGACQRCTYRNPTSVAECQICHGISQEPML